MAAFLIILAIVPGFFGIVMLYTAASAIQEAVAAVSCLIAAVLFAGGAIVAAINSVEKQLELTHNKLTAGWAERSRRHPETAAAQNAEGSALADGMRKCPNCESTIRNDSERCRFCVADPSASAIPEK